MERPASAGIALPQFRAHARAGGCGAVRPSRRGRWRTLSLVLVHVVMVAHFIHWRVAGATLTPLEPSEAIQTTRDGLVNAGVVLFSLAILSTLVFGRFFCGWGCHLIAYQDLSTWLLKRIGLRPRPFRSRLLVFVPLLAAFYMFLWPLARRFGVGEGWPRFEAHIVTDTFWVTMPGPIMALITLFVCGSLIVYFLGNKGFCTYACPYGGFFAPADAFAPGKIRVTDACEGCGHCTATCTSNVRVHEEVRRFGMVVDPGCMKCMDCIDVCPKNALYFGFGRPTVTRPAARAQAPARRFDYSWSEELWLAALFLMALYALRGLYDKIPFLLALGAAAICAFLLLTAARLLTQPSVRLHNWQLRAAGRWRPIGAAYAAGALLLLGLLLHSAFVQYHTHEGDYYRDLATEQQHAAGGALDAAVRESVARAVRHYELASGAALLVTPTTETALGALHLAVADPGSSDEAARIAAAERRLRRALAVEPTYHAALGKLAETLARQRRGEDALQYLAAALAAMPEMTDAPGNLVDLAARIGRPQAAVDVLERVVRRRPKLGPPRIALARAYLLLGDAARAEAELRRLIAAGRGQDLVEGHFRLGLLQADLGQIDAAVASLKRATELNPRAAPAWFWLGRVTAGAGRPAEAVAPLARARELDPYNRDFVSLWILGLRETGGLPQMRAALAAAPPDDVAARYALVFAHLASGDEPAAREEMARIRALRPNLSSPFPQ